MKIKTILIIFLLLTFTAVDVDANNLSEIITVYQLEASLLEQFDRLEHAEFISGIEVLNNQYQLVASVGSLPIVTAQHEDSEQVAISIAVRNNYIVNVHTKIVGEEASIPWIFENVVLLAQEISHKLERSIVDSGALKYIKNLEFLNSIENGIIYFGRPTCPVCQYFKPLLFEATREYPLPIYYFNTDRFRNHTDFLTILDNFEITSVPSLVQISEGQTTLISQDISDEWLSYFN